ncbi:phosphoribosyl-ATP diphosphatase [Lyngbya aestuarii]|uniref:phosphoribosyl-ATP diphosphatase n=1 Tax=Lyngbya aestuarii TaxID=118322 RepID=UPI00403E06A7
MKNPNLQETVKIINDCREGKLSHPHIEEILRKGDDKILRKIGEEAAEVIMACKDYKLGNGDKKHIEEEVGDVLYYLLIALAHNDVDAEKVFKKMWKKRQFDFLS